MIGVLCAFLFTFGAMTLLNGLLGDELKTRVKVGVIIVIGVVFGVAIGLLERMAR